MNSQNSPGYIPFYQQRVKLIPYLIALELGVELFYLAMRIVLELNVSYYLHGMFLLLTLIQFVLYRFRAIETLIIFTLISCDLAIFAMATSESLSTGLYLHFITTATAGLSLFGFPGWKKGIFFTLLSLTFFLLLHLTEFRILPYREFTTSQEHFFFVAHTSTMAIVSVSCIMLLLKVNFDSEQSLHNNRRIIEKQNEELKKANSELDRFVYSASHDLRAPLSSISGLLQLMKHEDPLALEEYMRLIQNRVDAMDKFIGEITDYSRNARMEVENKPVHLKSLALELWKSMHFLEGSTRVQLILGAGLDSHIMADPYRLRIILNNLLVNSIKYADGNKQPFVRLSSSRDGNFVNIHIEDNGIGIQPQYQERVFEMFYRATDTSKGSGLGLYIVTEAVTKLGGTIQLQSEFGQGTAITILLPDKEIRN